MTNYPWLHKKDEYINVDITKLPFPINVQGFGYFKNYEALREGYFNWNSESKSKFCDEVKRGSKTCDECGTKYVNSTCVMKDTVTCVRCLEKEQGREAREADAENRKNELIKKRKRLREDFIKVIDTIEYPLKFQGFTINNREQVKDIWLKAGQGKNAFRNRRNLVNNLKGAIDGGNNRDCKRNSR